MCGFQVLMIQELRLDLKLRDYIYYRSFANGKVSISFYVHLVFWLWSRWPFGHFCCPSRCSDTVTNAWSHLNLSYSLLSCVIRWSHQNLMRFLIPEYLKGLVTCWLFAAILGTQSQLQTCVLIHVILFHDCNSVHLFLAYSWTRTSLLYKIGWFNTTVTVRDASMLIFSQRSTSPKHKFSMLCF